MTNNIEQEVDEILEKVRKKNNKELSYALIKPLCLTRFKTMIII